MGDAGGRELIFSIHSADSNESGILDLVETIPDVFLSVTNFETAPNFDAAFCDPIKVARVTDLLKQDEYTGQRPPGNRYDGNKKPVYVQADILGRHLDSGESTNINQKLAEIIRNRGLGSPSDDCGHIVGRQYGGKMVDYNLFPQDRSINRGWGIWRYIWKWGVELLIRIWLIFQAPYDPMVRVRIRLFYPSSANDKPDRPTSFQYHLQFYLRRKKDDKESENETSANAEALRLFIRAAIHGEVPNECLYINEKHAKDSMIALSDRLKRLERMTRVSALRKLLQIYIEEIGHFINPPAASTPSTSKSRPPMSANKPFSWWDICPVVGSIRTLDDSIECAKEGDALGACVNGVLGVGGLALDALSLGTIGAFGNAAKSAVKVGTNVAVKEGTKTAVKTGTVVVVRRVFVIAVTEMAKEGIEALVQTAVTQAARRAVEAIARNAPE